ncbi:MAG: hypothetical protein RLZZ592_1954 [Pseudomonadota bacterium]|jgi:hypothetical protein
MTSRRGSETGRRHRVAEVVASQVAPLTRFSAQDLRELGPEQESWAELTVTTRQRVELEWTVTIHPGDAPEGLAVCPDAPALERELQARLDEAERTAPALIQHWAQEDSGRYRRLLPGGLFVAGLDAPLGVSEDCPDCAGRGRLACPACRGGHLDCTRCQARGRLVCASCHGSGRLACPDCQGRGQREAPTAPRPGEPAAPAVPCPTCIGRGWSPCPACAGQGEAPCPDCAGHGQRDCPHCQATGEIDCPGCHASGRRHRIGQLHEQLVVEDQIEVQHADPAVAETCARQLGDPVRIGQIAQLETIRWTTAPLAVQATHRLRLAVRQAALQIGARPQTFTALGPELWVPELHHAVSRLLALDQQTLERNTFGSGRHLGDALQRFLDSPLHVHLAVEGPTAAPPDDRIAPEHPAQAVQLMRQAVERLWLQRLWRPAVAALAGSGLISGALVMAAAPRLGWPQAALAGTALAAGLWSLLDWRLRRQLAGELGREAGPALTRTLPGAPPWRRSFLIQVGAALPTCGLLALAATRLPPAAARIAVQQTEVRNETLLADWARSDRDYRLRTYPPADWLQARAAAGDLDAQLVRAWALLLGIENTPAAAPARRLLDALAQGPRATEAAVRIGRARATLLLEPRAVTALQAAAAELETIQDSQVPEATYTVALLRLAPAVVARQGAAAGLEALQQAADLGHPSACLDLGRRLGAGQGLKRDTAAARRYLGFAAERGLPGAHRALAALK